MKHAWNKFHGFLGNLENGDRNAHSTGGRILRFAVLFKDRHKPARLSPCFAFSTSRPCKWTRGLIVIFLGFRIGPAPSMTSCFAAKRGLRDQDRIQVRAVSLCYRAKGDPHRGHLRPEMVSPVPPAPRRGIQLETRSVSFLNKRGLRDIHLKYPLNFKPALRHTERTVRAEPVFIRTAVRKFTRFP